MGFSENASIRAAIEVRATNGSAEQAMEWLLVIFCISYHLLFKFLAKIRRPFN